MEETKNKESQNYRKQSENHGVRPENFPLRHLHDGRYINIFK